MHRRNFLKKIFFLSTGFLTLKMKIFASEILKPFNLENGIFVNNFIRHQKSFKDLWKWRKEAKNRPDPISFPLIKNDPNYLNQNKSDTTLTWVGHATFLFQLNGYNVLTDPHFSRRASPLSFMGPERTTPPGLEIKDLPLIDVVVISHNHYDHLDKQSIQSLIKRQENKQPVFFVPLKLKKTLQNFGATNIIEHEWWQVSKYKQLEIHSVPVQHWSKRSLNDTNKTLWCGWVIKSKNFQYFFVGDTGYSKDFENIKKKFGPMDLASIPIGAYEPRWFMKDSHCNVEEAIQIHKDIKSKKSIAMHWGTFQLTDEPMDEPIQLLSKLTQKLDNPKKFTALMHGQTIKI
jgi:N-acyl-phosphatidylethanolamine-hydrolysing phospholipase D